MKGTLSLAAVAGLLIVSSANAGTANLGNSGWQAIWDASLDPYVSIIYVDETADSVYVQKSAEFTQGPGLGGLFPTIPITFRQTGPSAISQIVIQDEILTNSTGVDWTDFHWDLLDGPDAWFKHDPGWFFTTTPLSHQQFVASDRGFWVDGFGLGPGGTNLAVPAGSVWFPGDGISDGDLIMGVVSKAAAPYTTFTLKETPTPEPASLLLLALGALMLRRR